MTLEDIVYSRMTGCESLSSILSRYDGRPAVFLQRAPDDSMPGWEQGKSQYPRAEFLIDMTADPERQSSGYLTVYVYSSDESTPPEEIVPKIREALADIIVMADGMAYAISWHRMELFTTKNEVSANTFVNGAMVAFLLIAFPSQETGTPDPVIGLNERLKAEWNNLMILGRDSFGDVYEPKNNAPAIYCRVDSYKTKRETYAVRWVEARISVHVIAPSAEARSRWARAVADLLQLEGGLFLLDDSWMTVWSVEVNNRADPLTAGQAVLKAEYGIIPVRYSHPMRDVHIVSDLPQEGE